MDNLWPSTSKFSLNTKRQQSERLSPLISFSPCTWTLSDHPYKNCSSKSFISNINNQRDPFSFFSHSKQAPLSLKRTQAADQTGSTHPATIMLNMSRSSWFRGGCTMTQSGLTKSLNLTQWDKNLLLHFQGDLNPPYLFNISNPPVTQVIPRHLHFPPFH